MLDNADRIWNRACDPFAQLSASGDQALQAVLLVHGQVMNGGVASAMEYLSPEEIGAAVRGLEYFGRQDVGQVLREALHLTFPEGGITDPEARERHVDTLDDQIHQRLEELDDAYNVLLPQDGVLESAFRERLRVSSDDFAPLS